MTYHNKKEEVLDVQLTSEGRRLLSQGRFKPAYYAFYDDDILYDIAYASGTEIQNLSQDRILDETPYPKTNARFKEAVESGQVNYKNGKKSNENIKKNKYLKESPFLTPLGSYNSQTQTAPYFEVKVVSNHENGLTTGSAQVLPNAAMTIPQYDITCSYQYFYVKENDTVYAREEPLILHILEKNVQFSNFTEDFEIEIYEATGSLDDLTQPKVFLRIDDKPRTPQEEIEQQLKIQRLSQEVPNLISDNLLVLLDEEAEPLFDAELLIEKAPSSKTKVVCED